MATEFLGDVPSTVAPGAADTVLIGVPSSGPEIIDGNGNAAAIYLAGEMALHGNFVAGAVQLGAATISLPLTTLDILSASTLTAGTAALDASTAVVGAGASLAVTGRLNLLAGLGLFDHAVVSAGTLVMFGSIAIDATSSMEVGGGGSAAAGALIVDAGSDATIGGSLFANLVADGTVEVASEGSVPKTVTLHGALSGGGLVKIDAMDEFVLTGAGSGAGTIEFAGTLAELDMSAGGGLEETIAGFAATDTILVPGSVAGGTFAGGVLALTDALGAPVLSLAFSGVPVGDTLLVLPSPGDASAIVLTAGTLLTGPPPAPAAGTSGGQYTWIGHGGMWNDPANWSEAATSLTAPGSNNAVQILGSDGDISPWQVISGSGDAYMLNVDGPVALSGNFAVHDLEAYLPNSSLDLVAGTTLLVDTADLGGYVALAGVGTTLAATGPMYFFGGTLALVGGAFLSDTFTSGIGGMLIAIDAESTVEIGTSGGGIAGALNVDAGVDTGLGVNLLGNLVNAGTVECSADFAVSGSIVGVGTMVANSLNGSIVLAGSVVGSQTMELDGNFETLTLGAAARPVIAGFAADDAIVMQTPFTRAAWAASGPGGTLTLTNDGSVVDALNLLGSYDPNGIVVLPAATNGTIEVATASVACFAEGTRIATPRGPVAVERLRVGDQVATVRGVAPIKWLGHRRVDCSRHPRPHDVLPVRIRRHAFGASQPSCDLLLSPDHAVQCGSVLIPVRYLVNGRSVVQEEVDHIIYWHVELPAHGVLLAENLPCESYLDTGNRGAFAGEVSQHLHPDFALRVWDTKSCAPLIRSGPLLAAARRLLLAPLAAAMTEDAGLRLTTGRRRPSAEIADGIWRVRLGRSKTLRLRSRAHIPAHIRSDSDDTRRLGVAVAELTLDGAAVDASRFISGWHAAEPGWRWTDGDALLDVRNASELRFRIPTAGRYWLGVSRSALG